MKTHLLLIPFVAVLLSGCVGTGPNTQRGAVGGAALGGVAGAIIGNQSGRPLEGAAIGGVLGAVAGGSIGNSVDQQNGTLYPETQVPPQPLYEPVPPAPDYYYVWYPGVWVIFDHHYVWQHGYWGVPHHREYYGRRYYGPRYRR